jgi:hypothetical protein
MRPSSDQELSHEEPGRQEAIGEAANGGQGEEQISDNASLDLSISFRFFFGLPCEFLGTRVFYWSSCYL